MPCLDIDKRNVVFNLQAENRDDAIRKIISIMAQNGHVNLEYADEVIERENKYPTGLPTEGILVAIPHARSNNIHKTTTAVAILENPVEFRNMANPQQTILAEIVFVLANTDFEKQLLDLQRLMNCCANPEALYMIKNSKTAEEIISVFEKYDTEPE